MSIRDLQTSALDINNKYNIYLQCVQNDDVILNITVYDKSLQADLSNYTCRLKAFKSDQIPLIQNTNIDVTGNVVKIECSKQLTTTAGVVKAELQFIEKSTLTKKSTFFIEIKVEKSALNIDGAVSTPICTLLEEIDNKLDQIENIGQVLDEAKAVRDTLENDISTGNTTHSNIQNSIIDANSKKQEVETSISNASNKIADVETSIINANNSKTALDKSKNAADTSKNNLDEANTLAEHNIEELNKLGDVTNLAAKVEKNISDIANNTTNISNNTASINNLSSQMNDIKQDMSQLSNPNLLINGDFQVWQRGTNFNISNDGKYNYTSDRWIVQTDSADITVTSLQNDGMRVDMQQFGGTYLNVIQLLEIPYYKKLVGKDITIRVKFKNNVSNIAIGIRAFPDSAYAHTLISETKNEFTITTKVPECSTDCEKFMIYVQSKTKQILDFDYIKVELGLTATPFIPRSYAEEFALCQRYYQTIDWITVSKTPNDNLVHTITFSPMRVVPTKTIGSLCGWDGTGGIDVAYIVDINSVRAFRIRTDTSNSAYKWYDIKNIVLDAEIY